MAVKLHQRQAISYKSSKARIVHTGIPQGSMLSPSLLSFYLADISRPTELVKRICYTDDITVWGIRSQNSGTRAQSQHLFNGDVPFLTGQLAIDISTKVISNPFTPDPAQANTHPKIKFDDS